MLAVKMSLHLAGTMISDYRISSSTWLQEVTQYRYASVITNASIPQTMIVALTTRDRKEYVTRF